MAFITFLHLRCFSYPLLKYGILTSSFYASPWRKDKKKIQMTLTLQNAHIPDRQTTASNLSEQSVQNDAIEQASFHASLTHKHILNRNPVLLQQNKLAVQ